ncbi:hypothetical protein Tco_0077899 [Tanacetum coccineum]
MDGLSLSQSKDVEIVKEHKVTKPKAPKEPQVTQPVDKGKSIAKDTEDSPPKHVNASGKIRASPRGSSKTFKVLLGDGTLFRGTHDEVSMI